MPHCEKCHQPIIERGIKIPNRVRGKWDFIDDMEIGDSVLTKTEKDYDAVRHALRHRNMKARTAKLGDGSGWRVWRIE